MDLTADLNDCAIPIAHGNARLRRGSPEQLQLQLLVAILDCRRGSGAMTSDPHGLIWEPLVGIR